MKSEIKFTSTEFEMSGPWMPGMGPKARLCEIIVDNKAVAQGYAILDDKGNFKEFVPCGCQMTLSGQSDSQRRSGEHD